MKNLRKLCLSILTVLAFTATANAGGGDAPAKTDTKPVESKPVDTKPADGTLKTGVQECDDYLNKLSNFVRNCSKFTPEVKAQYEKVLKDSQAQFGAYSKLEGEAKQAVVSSCKQGADAMKQSATAMGCEF